jgi:hypothetical protein
VSGLSGSTQAGFDPSLLLQTVVQNKQMLIALGGLLLGIVLVVFAVRGVVGCVSGAFSRGDEQQSEKPAAEKHQAVRIELAMIGDILQHSGVYESGFLEDGTRNYDHIFAHIGSELQGADIKVVNQETCM